MTLKISAIVKEEKLDELKEFELEQLRLNILQDTYKAVLKYEGYSEEMYYLFFTRLKAPFSTGDNKLIMLWNQYRLLFNVHSDVNALGVDILEKNFNEATTLKDKVFWLQLYSYRVKRVYSIVTENTLKELESV